MKRGMILNGRHRVYVGKEIITIETSWATHTHFIRSIMEQDTLLMLLRALTKLRKSMHQVIRKLLRYSVIS